MLVSYDGFSAVSLFSIILIRINNYYNYNKGIMIFIIINGMIIVVMMEMQ